MEPATDTFQPRNTLNTQKEQQYREYEVNEAVTLHDGLPVLTPMGEFTGSVNDPVERRVNAEYFPLVPSATQSPPQ